MYHILIHKPNLLMFRVKESSCFTEHTFCVLSSLRESKLLAQMNNQHLCYGVALLFPSLTCRPFLRIVSVMKAAEGRNLLCFPNLKNNTSPPTPRKNSSSVSRVHLLAYFDMKRALTDSPARKAAQKFQKILLD